MPTGYPALKNPPYKRNRINRVAQRTQKTLLPLVAVGGSLAGLPASALELGDMTVQSRLGQPLRASIAYSLAPHEQLASSCVTLGAAASASGLPGIGRASISIANGIILLTGKTPVREPMVAAHVVVDCPYTANLSREYMLFVDPAGPAFDQQTVVQTASAAPAASARRTTAVASRRAPTATTVSREPIGKSTRYQVQRGDSLSQIAERVNNRSISLWPAVNAIFDANPDAFIDNDPNKLKAGSWLTIPSFDGSEPVVSAAPPSGVTSAESVMEPSFELSDNEVSETNAVAESAMVDVNEALSDATADLRPGDIIVDSDNPFVDASDATTNNVVIPDTELAGPTTTSSSPNVATAVINTSTQKSSASWVMWLAGGFALLIGLLLFGRRFREHDSTPPISAAADQPMRRRNDGNTENIEALEPMDFDMPDDSPTDENLALDADLIIGMGLEHSTDMDVAQDFGFATPTAVDIELPFEPEATVSSSDTDIMAQVGTSTHSILDSEILPDNDDYDMSVIIDATKMPAPEDVTERDLKAIEVSTVDNDAGTDDYTINTEVDLNILEQDYEEELSATQALNVEIARAAEEIAKTMGNKDDATVDMPRASVTELDSTAQMATRKGQNDDLDDDTGITEALTVSMTSDDKTVEMPSAENDDTTEMEIEGGKVDTKAV